MNEGYTVHKRPRPFLYRYAREGYYKVFNQIKPLYYRVRKPNTSGVKVLVTCGNEVLLVRMGYGQRYWSAPGGAVDAGETPEVAAKRELFEETKLEVDKLVHIATKEYQHEHKQDTVYVFQAALDVPCDIVIDDQEIKDAGWFAIDNLPEPHSPRLVQMVEAFKNRGGLKCR